jgi:hypothetical protein
MIAIKIDGVEISEAVIRTEQMELRVLEMGTDRITFEVKAVYGESFNFVPRFFRLCRRILRCGQGPGHPCRSGARNHPEHGRFRREASL